MIQISVFINMDICRSFPCMTQIHHAKVFKKVMASIRKKEIMDSVDAF
jgi:hypothetical protein